MVQFIVATVNKTSHRTLMVTPEPPSRFAFNGILHPSSDFMRSLVSTLPSLLVKSLISLYAWSRSEPA